MVFALEVLTVVTGLVVDFGDVEVETTVTVVSTVVVFGLAELVVEVVEDVEVLVVVTGLFMGPLK